VISDLAQLQLAGLKTGAAFLSQWAEMTTRYSEQVGKTLSGLARDPKNYEQAAAEVMDEYRKYLGQLTNLPRISALRFYRELERIRHEIADAPP
jgi:hypothetical protein